MQMVDDGTIGFSGESREISTEAKFTLLFALGGFFGLFCVLAVVFSDMALPTKIALCIFGTVFMIICVVVRIIVTSKEVKQDEVIYDDSSVTDPPQYQTVVVNTPILENKETFPPNPDYPYFIPPKMYQNTPM